MELVSSNEFSQHEIDNAKDDLGRATAQFVANMLRIMAGAGQPEELVSQMKELVHSGVELQKMKGSCSAVMTDALLDWRKKSDEARDRLLSEMFENDDLTKPPDAKKSKAYEQIGGETQTVHYALRLAAARMLNSNAQASIAEGKMLAAAREWDKAMRWYTP